MLRLVRSTVHRVSPPSRSRFLCFMVIPAPCAGDNSPPPNGQAAATMSPRFAVQCVSRVPCQQAFAGRIFVNMRWRMRASSGECRYRVSGTHQTRPVRSCSRRYCCGLERLGATRLARRSRTSAFHLGFGLTQQAVAVLLQRLAALIDGDRLFSSTSPRSRRPTMRLQLLQRGSKLICLMSPCLAAVLRRPCCSVSEITPTGSQLPASIRLLT